MFGRFSVAAFCCAMAAGCATLPTEQADGVSLAAVEERVKCEIGRAYRDLSSDPQFPDLSTWAAGLTLSLAVDSTGSVTPSTSLVGPYGSLSPLDVSAGVSFNAKRTALLNIYTAFAEAARHHCDDAPHGQPIEGQLGLAEWIERVFRDQLEVERRAAGLGNSGQTAPFNSKDKSIGYSLDFILTIDAGVTPNFIITKGTAKSAFALDSKSTHSIDIAMLEMSRADFKAKFKTVFVPEVTKPVENPDPDARQFTPFIKQVVRPAHTEKRLVGYEHVIGLETKDRLDSVLLQLNNKAIIQSLRR